MRMSDELTPWGKHENEIICFDNVFNEQVETDVEGLKSDGVYRKGFQDFPIFNVTEDEFTRNMESHRQRCRFTSEKVKRFCRESRYKNPFYIKANINGRDYIRRIK